MSRFSDMVNAMRNNYGSSGNTAQPVNNVQVNYANQQAMIQRQEQARMREEERRRRLEEERRKREEERKRKEEERRAEEQRRKEQENIRAEEARAKAQKALEKSKENNFQQVQQRSETTSASNARRLAEQSLGDNKQSVQRELANRALESSKSLEKSEQSIRRLEEKRNKEVQDSLDFSYAQKQNQEREKYRKEIENRVGIGREINAKKGWEEQARKNGYTDDDIQTAYYAWLSDVDNELSTIPDFMSREATVNRIMNGKNVSLSGSYDLNDPTAYLPKKKDGTFLHDSAVNIEDTVDNLRSGLQQWNANTGRGIANLVEAVNPESNYKENYDEQLINSGYYDRLQQLNNNDMAGTFLGRVAQGVGANVPNAILGGLTGLSGASLGMAGLGAYGGSSQNALERGLDTQKATEYGLLNAGVELGTELLNPISDYIPMVGKSMGLKDILGEGFEEIESALVEPLLESSYFGGNPMDEYASREYWRNVAEQGLLGSTIALASNPTGAINGVRADIDNRLVNDLNNVVNDAIATEQARTQPENVQELNPTSLKDNKNYDEFVNENFETLKQWINSDRSKGMRDIENAWYESRHNAESKNLYEIDSYDELLNGSPFRDNAYFGWFRNADSGYKPELANTLFSTEGELNKGMNIAYWGYRSAIDDYDYMSQRWLTNNAMPFEEWLYTPITLYRGTGDSQSVDSDNFIAFTPNREIAEKFVRGNKGNLEEIQIRPIDTWGSYNLTGEQEIWVPSSFLENRNDSRLQPDQEQARTPLETPEQLDLFSGEEVPTVENFVQRPQQPDLPSSFFEALQESVNNDTPLLGFDEVNYALNKARDSGVVFNNNDEQRQFITRQFIENQMQEQLADTELADDPIIQDFIEEQTDEATERIMNVTRGAKNLAEGKGAGSNETVTRDTQSIYEQKIAQEMGDVMYETIKETGDEGIFSKSMREVEESGVEEALNKFKNNLNTAITGDGIFDTLWKMRKGELLTNKKLVKQVSDGFAIRETLERQKQDIIRDLQAKGYAVRENTVEGDIRATIYGNGQQLNTKEANDYAKRLNAINSELADVNYVMHTISHNAGLILGEYSRLDALTPSKQRQAIEDVVARLNAELHKKFHKQFQNGKLTDIEVNPELMEQFRNAETQDERNAIAEQIQEDIASQIPASMGEKIRALRYLNMLGNPVTWIRNGLGNTLEQGMYKTRDIAGVLIEKYLDSRGHVRYDRLNRSNAYDKALIQYAQDHVLETLENDYAEWKKVGGNKRAFFKSKGYSGALLNKLVGWQGSTFNLNGDEVGLEKIVNAVANNLKANNATVTDDGLLGGVNFNQIVRDGYNQAKKQYIDSSELRFRRAKNATDGNQIEQASKIFDTLRGDFKTVGNKYTSNGDIDARSFEGGIRARAQENIFGDSTLGKVVNSANNLTNYVLNDSIIGDTAFTKYRYARTLAQALNAQGIDIKSVGENGVTLVRDGVELSKGETQALLETLDAQAFQDARESVYRDFSAVARAINQLADSNGLANIIIGGNIPFTTTPINIVKRAVEFSPAGLLYTVHKQSKMLERGEITPSTFINNLAKGMSGTAFSAVGALLARMGMIRARGDKKDEKEHKYEVNNGLQDYSLVLPNGDTYSLESMAPASTVLMYGAWVYELLKRNDFDIFDTGNDFMKNWDGILTPLLDMTMLSGLKDTLNSFGEDSFKGILLKTLENYVGQFTPTMGAKINKVFDPVTRSTWSDNLLERMFRNFVNKIPFADATWALMTGDHYLKPSLNNRGEEIQNVGGNALVRLAYNFLSPGTYKENTMNQNMTDASFTNVDDELLRLYESKEVDATKKQYLLPYKVYSFNVDGEKMNLTAQEKDEYNKEYLQNVRKQVEAIMSSPLYQNMTDSERANLITGVQNYYYNKIKQNYFDKVAPGGYKLSGANQAIEGLQDIGVEPYQVLYYKSITNMKDKDGNTINNSGALQVREAMESAGVYDDILNAYRTGKIDNLNSVGLNNKVAKMSDSEYMYNMELLDNGLLGATKSKTNEEKRESFNSAYEENQALEKKYSDIGVNTQSIYKTNDVKSKYDDNGKAITYSQDLLAREAMGEDFGKLIEAVQDGRISIDEAIKDTGIGKTVFMMSEDEFQKDLGYLNDGTWTNATYNKLMNKKATWGTYKNYSGKSSNTSNTSKSSGGYSKSRKRSSGGSSRVSNKVKSVSSSSKSTKAKASELSTYMKTVLKEQDKGAKSTGNAVKKSMENAIKNLRKSDQELYNEIMSSHNKNVEALRKELGLKKQ